MDILGKLILTGIGVLFLVMLLSITVVMVYAVAVGIKSSIEERRNKRDKDDSEP